MTEPAAIKATFVDVRPVKTRSLVQLVFEIPVEQADAALEALGGYPQPKEGKWVAIARLNPALDTVQDRLEQAEKPKRPPATTRAEKRPWHELPLPQQAGILCADGRFQAWLPKWAGNDVANKVLRNFHSQPERDEATAALLRYLCGVQSRKELDSNPFSAKQFGEIAEQFERDTGRMAEVHD